jgi:hypothetical protein
MQDELFDRRLGALFISDAAGAIPDGTSLLSQINRRLDQRRRSRRPAVLVASTIVIGVAVLFSMTPARAAIGQLLPFGWLQRFGTVLIGPTPLPSHVGSGKPPSGRSQPVPQGYALPRLTLAEAQQQAAFPIQQPTSLPRGVVFRFAFVAQDGEWADVSYGPVNDPSRGMGLQMQRGAPVGGYAIPASAARTVRVNGRDAVYAPGGWAGPGSWNSTSDQGLLSWQANGFTYVLQFSGLGLSQADLIRIAESVR